MLKHLSSISIKMYACSYVYDTLCKHTQITHGHNIIHSLQFTEDGEPPLPEEGDEADTEILDYTDPEVFLLVYKWYLPPEKLVDVLIE